MARATRKTPDPVPDTIVLELSVAEAQLIADILGGQERPLGTTIYDALEPLGFGVRTRKTHYKKLEINHA